jgi:hypothetical protein
MERQLLLSYLSGSRKSEDLVANSRAISNAVRFDAQILNGLTRYSRDLNLGLKAERCVWCANAIAEMFYLLSVDGEKKMVMAGALNDQLMSKDVGATYAMLHVVNRVLQTHLVDEEYKVPHSNAYESITVEMLDARHSEIISIFTEMCQFERNLA